MKVFADQLQFYTAIIFVLTAKTKQVGFRLTRIIDLSDMDIVAETLPEGISGYFQIPAFLASADLQGVSVRFPAAKPAIKKRLVIRIVDIDFVGSDPANGLVALTWLVPTANVASVCS